MAHIVLWISILGWGGGLTALTLFAIRMQKERLRWLRYATYYTVAGVAYLMLLQFVFYLFTFLDVPYHYIFRKMPFLGLLAAILLPIQHLFFTLLAFQGSGITLKKSTKIFILIGVILLNSGAFYINAHTFFLKKISYPDWSWGFTNLSQLLVSVLAGTIPAGIALMKSMHKNQTSLEKYICLISGIYIAATPLHLISFIKYRRPFYYTGSELYLFFFIIGIVFVLFSIVSIIFNTKAIGQYLFPLPQEMPKALLTELSISPREADVINHILKGLRPAEISEELFISIRTVNAHIQNVYKKLGVSGRPALIKKLREYTYTH